MSNTIEAGNRQHWADSLRGLAVVLVVLQHASGVPQVVIGQESPGRVWEVVMAALAPFRIPTLLILSGLLLPRSVAKPFSVYVDGKVRKVLWPFVVWSVLTVLAAGTSDPRAMGFWLWAGGVFHMWYLSVLLVGYAIGVVVRWVPGWIPAVLFIAILGFGDPSTNTIRRALFYGCIFFIGATLAPALRRWLGARMKWAVAASIFGLVVAGMAAMGMVSITPEVPWSFLLALPGVLAVIWGWCRLPRMLSLEAIGRRSMVLYCVHFPVQIVVAHFFAGVGLVEPTLAVPISFIVGLLVPLALMTVYAKIEWLFVMPRMPLLKSVAA